MAVGSGGPAVDGSRFDSAGSWSDPPEHRTEAIDDRLYAGKLADRIRSAIVELPPRRREVVKLRDVEGMSSSEVCRQAVELVTDYLEGANTEDLTPQMQDEFIALYRQWQAEGGDQDQWHRPAGAAGASGRHGERDGKAA